MSKIFSKLLSQHPLSIDTIVDEKFEFVPCVQFFMDFPFFQIALTRSIFELEKCTFFSNRSKFRQKLIGNVISELRCLRSCLKKEHFLAKKLRVRAI